MMLLLLLVASIPQEKRHPESSGDALKFVLSACVKCDK